MERLRGPAQWNDAFRAAGYSDDHARHFIVKIKSKVAEGVKLGEVQAARHVRQGRQVWPTPSSIEGCT